MFYLHALQYNKGPRMEPWGTPQVRVATEQEALPVITERDLNKIAVCWLCIQSAT